MQEERPGSAPDDQPDAQPGDLQPGDLQPGDLQPGDLQPEGFQPVRASGPIPLPPATPAPADSRLLAKTPPKVWETGETPGETRVPGTRRLWLAGALAIGVVITSVTAVAVLDNRADDSSRNRTTQAGAGAGQPDVPEFSLPGAPVVEPSAKSGMSSPQSSRSTDGDSDSVETQQRGTKPAESTEPSKSASGKPPASKPSTITRKSVQSVNYPDRYWHLSDSVVRLDPLSSRSSAGTRKDASFKVVRGLADSDCYSFATSDGRYLRHRNFLLRADLNDGSGLFKKDATFCPRQSAYSGAVMLESVNYPGRFLRHKDFVLRLDPYENSGLYWADSAFRLVKGLA